VSSQEKGYASDALVSFNSGGYSACLSSLEMLEVLRPSDVKVAHNKIVAQCRAATQSSTQLPLPEVVKQLEGLAKTAGINLGIDGLKEEDVDWPLIVYNLAVAKFQQKQYIQAAQLSSKLEHSEKTGADLKKKVYFLNAELSLALRQPEEAFKYIKIIQSLVGNNEEESSRILMLKARSQVLGRQLKSSKKELKTVSLPGSQGITCEFVRSNIEYQCKNYRKSIKMLNSGAQLAGNRVFPHYYNNLGCIHQNMKKPNLAVYYFKNAMEKLDGGNNGADVSQAQKVDGEKELGCFNGVPQPQVMYNISLSLLHAKRPHIAFELLMEVASSFYLDPHIWFHLAECCIQHLKERSSQELGHGEVGAGPTHKFIASNPQGPSLGSGAESGGGEGGIVPGLTYDFAYVCLKNAESLLPKNESVDTSAFCQTVGCVGNPMTWADVEQLRLAILAAKAYVALSVGDFLMAGSYADTMLQIPSLPGGYSMLAHLYAAESLIFQDRLTDAIKHLDPENLSDITFPENSAPVEIASSSTADVSDCRNLMHLNLAVGFALREEWDKAGGLARQLCLSDGGLVGNLGVQVLILNLYISLRKGDIATAHHILLQRYPSLKQQHSQNSIV